MKATSSGKKRVSWLQLRDKLTDFSFALPALIFFIIFVYYPIADLFRISFTDWNLMKEQQNYVGFKNFIWLFNGSGFKTFKQSLWVTFSYTFWEIVITLIGGILLACLFGKLNRRYGFMRSVVFMPKYIAISTSGIVFAWILNDKYGLLNYILGAFGISPVNWLNSEQTALTSVLFLTAWRVVGYAMMIYLSAIQGISKDYYEAAELDGASAFKRFRYITLPLLSPTTLFLFVTTFIASMKVFQSVDVMTAGGPYRATNVMVFWIYNLAFGDFRVDRAAAVSVVFFMILLVCTGLTMKVSNKSVNYDS